MRAGNLVWEKCLKWGQVQVPTTPSGPGGACAARFSVDGTWSQGGTLYAVFNFYLTSTGGSTIQTPYNIAVNSNSYTGVISTWNWKVRLPHPILSNRCHDNFDDLPNVPVGLGAI